MSKKKKGFLHGGKEDKETKQIFTMSKKKKGLIAWCY